MASPNLLLERTSDMRGRRPISVTILLMMAVAVPVPAIAQAPTESAGTVLIDAGAEPRRELRYTWTDEYTERLEAVIEVDVAADESGMPVMSMRLPMTMSILARVTDVADDGRARIAMVYDDLAFGPFEASGGGLDDGDQAAAALSEGFDEVTRLLSDLRAWQVMDDRGAVLRSGMELPSGIPTEISEQLAQASGSVALLPEEPVGVGARWETTAATVSQGVPIAVTTSIELVAVEDDEITLEMSMRLADRSDALPPTVDPFDTFTLDGQGTNRLDLRGIFPRELTTGLAMTMAGDLPDEAGTPVPVEMSIDVSMSMESSPTD